MGLRVRTVAAMNRKKTVWICSSWWSGNTNEINAEATNNTYNNHSAFPGLSHCTVQFAARTETRTPRNISELLSQVVPNSRLNWMTLLVSSNRKATPMSAKAV